MLWVFALPAFLIGGCTEVTTPTTAPLTFAVAGKATEDGPLVALEGAQLCETGTANCEVSDARGEVTIDLPIGEESSYTLEREGYASYLVAYVMPADGYHGGTFEMAQNQLMVARHRSVNSPYPMISTGTILFGLASPFPGATFELVDATGEPFYVDEEINWRLDLTATTSYGWGGFVEVPPGDEFQIKLGGKADSCTPLWAWPGDVANTVIFPVLERYVTIASANCAPP